MPAMERESRSNGPTGKAGGASNRHRERRLRVTRSVSLPRSEINYRYSRSSGPGGQHAQKSDTRVEASFDVEASSALSETQKRRVVAKAGPVLRAVAQDERSQWRNRELATKRLVDSLREALRVPRRRRPTKPTKASRERRLAQKRRRSDVKRLRRPPPD
jgi:ribosome-associated protein